MVNQVGLGAAPDSQENHAPVVGATKPKSKPKPARPSTATPKLTAAGGNRLLMAPPSPSRAPSARRPLVSATDWR